ncbi:16S rRNA (cytosine(1402)-N(4))-methyltransferase [Candidatus Saccharibacteria bacterium RIFCSPHIGHO2_12_FULL_47_16b]|nr:MAG: 16S rRNA (cytosine(1402)-N(4))-methyltransferase [Candidatus Saccharibacteria bacterium RIFCSPHIGHO2_12_FULL_47_16b]
MSKTNIHHIPVMLKQVIGCLKPARGESYLDVTAGMGGHGAAVIAATAAPQKATLVDRDPQVAQVLGDKFPAAQVLNQDFLSASRKLLNDGKKFDMILADLGASSLHFEDADRGFSFRKSGPLDMRMDTHQELTAWQIVNNWSQKDLATIFRKYGEEPRADLVAKAIVSARPINDTLQLAAIISRAVPKRGKIHPATKLFQAIRIAVNDELGQLEQSLPIWLKLLKNNGRLAVISFHSLEDRIAKQFFAEHAKSSFDAELKLLTKKPITARHEEIVSNPRARSAKLRAAAKIKTKK